MSIQDMKMVSDLNKITETFFLWQKVKLLLYSPFFFFFFL